VTKAAAAEKAKAAAEAAGAAKLNPVQHPSVEMSAAGSPAPPESPAAEVVTTVKKGKDAGGRRRTSIAAAPEEKEAAEPFKSSAPAATESFKSSAPSKQRDKKGQIVALDKKEKDNAKAAAVKAAEHKAAEAAAKAAEIEKRKLEEEARRAAAKAAAAFEARKATVPSIDFEGAWRVGGEYEVRYTAKESGNFALHIWCDVEGNGERRRLPGSPFHLHVSAAAPSWTGSSIGNSEKNSYVAGEKLELFPQLRDSFGNPAASTDRWKPPDNQASLATSIMQELLQQHGVGLLPVSMKYQPTDDVQRSADNDERSSSPTKTKRRPSLANASTPQLRLLHARSPTKRGTAIGAEREKVAPVYELTAWLVTPRGKSALSLKKDENALGLHRVDDYELTMAGQYEANITLNGTPINGSPVCFEVTPAPPSGKLSYVSAPEGPAYVKLPYELKLVTLDKFGNLLSTGGERVDGKVLGSTTTPCTVVDHKDGTYSLHFTVNNTGSFNVEVRVNGAKVKGDETEVEQMLADRAEERRKVALKAKAKQRDNLAPATEAKGLVEAHAIPEVAAAMSATEGLADVAKVGPGPPLDVTDLTATI